MDQLLWNVAETAHAVRRSVDRRAATLGVTRAQWRVLSWLHREPNLRQVELAERLDIEPITLCRMIDRLEEAGLVERRRDPEDRRAWRLALTERANPVIESLHEVGRELTVEALAGIAPEQVEQVRALLARMRSNLAAMESAIKAAG